MSDPDFPTPPAATPESPTTRLPARVVFFDGLCGVCDRTVQMLLERDTRGRLWFAPLQGRTAQQLRACCGSEFPADTDSLVFLDNTGGTPQFLLQSRASFAIAREVESLRAWAWLSLVPRPLTELAYRAFAALRYRLFDRRDACRIPSPEQASRFLE